MKLSIDLKDSELNKEVRKLVEANCLSLIRKEINKSLEAFVEKELSKRSKQQIGLAVTNACKNFVWNMDAKETENFHEKFISTFDKTLADKDFYLEERLQQEIKRRVDAMFKKDR